MAAPTGRYLADVFERRTVWLIAVGVALVAVGFGGGAWSIGFKDFVGEASKAILAAGFTGLVIAVVVKEYERATKKADEATSLRVGLAPYAESWRQHRTGLNVLVTLALLPVEPGVIEDEGRLTMLSKLLYVLSKHDDAENRSSVADALGSFDLDWDSVETALAGLRRVAPDVHRVGDERIRHAVSEVLPQLDDDAFSDGVQDAIDSCRMLRDAIAANAPDVSGLARIAYVALVFPLETLRRTREVEAYATTPSFSSR